MKGKNSNKEDRDHTKKLYDREVELNEILSKLNIEKDKLITAYQNRLMNQQSRDDIQ